MRLTHPRAEFAFGREIEGLVGLGGILQIGREHTLSGQRAVVPAPSAELVGAVVAYGKQDGVVGRVLELHPEAVVVDVHVVLAAPGVGAAVPVRVHIAQVRGVAVDHQDVALVAGGGLEDGVDWPVGVAEERVHRDRALPGGPVEDHHHPGPVGAVDGADHLVAPGVGMQPEIAGAVGRADRRQLGIPGTAVKGARLQAAVGAPDEHGLARPAAALDVLHAHGLEVVVVGDVRVQRLLPGPDAAVPDQAEGGGVRVREDQGDLARARVGGHLDEVLVAARGQPRDRGAVHHPGPLVVDPILEVGVGADHDDDPPAQGLHGRVETAV